MPGMLRKSTAFLPRYQKFESISLHRRVRRVRKLSTTNFWFQERRERYVKGITVLYNRERDIALATYDGEAAANAIFSLAEAIHGANIAMVARALNSEAEMLFEYGGDRGSNIHLIALIAVRRKLLDAASSNGERAVANRNLGLALQRLGERESGTARLEEAVKAYRAALEERSRDRVPLQCADMQDNLAAALFRLGERNSTTARPEEALAAFDECLTIVETTWPEEWVQQVRTNRDEAMAEIARRSPKKVVLQRLYVSVLWSFRAGMPMLQAGRIGCRGTWDVSPTAAGLHRRFTPETHNPACFDQMLLVFVA